MTRLFALAVGLGLFTWVGFGLIAVGYRRVGFAVAVLAAGLMFAVGLLASLIPAVEMVL